MILGPILAGFLIGRLLLAANDCAQIYRSVEGQVPPKIIFTGVELDSGQKVSIQKTLEFMSTNFLGDYDFPKYVTINVLELSANLGFYNHDDSTICMNKECFISATESTVFAHEFGHLLKNYNVNPKVRAPYWSEFINRKELRRLAKLNYRNLPRSVTREEHHAALDVIDQASEGLREFRRVEIPYDELFAETVEYLSYREAQSGDGTNKLTEGLQKKFEGFTTPDDYVDLLLSQSRVAIKNTLDRGVSSSIVMTAVRNTIQNELTRRFQDKAGLEESSEFSKKSLLQELKRNLP